MEQDKQFHKTLTIIPNDLIFDNILTRLPVKSLIRFKSVSKIWHSLISSPQFIKSHLQFSSSFSPHFLLQSHTSLHTLPYTPYNTLNQLVNLDHPWNFVLNLVGSCNGLICLYVITFSIVVPSCSEYFVLWNPATHHSRHVSIPPYVQPNLRIRGFGYDGSTVDDYKISAAFSWGNCLWVFSLNIGDWKYVDIPSHLDFQSVDILTGFHFDGTLYWNVTEEDLIRIFSFNLVEEQFDEEVPLLIAENMVSHVVGVDLCVFNGCLSIISHSCDQSDVFVRKKQGDLTSLSWEKLFSISLAPSVIFMDFSTAGNCLVQQRIDMSHCNSEGSPPKQWLSEFKLIDPTLEDVEHFQGIGFEHKNVHSVHHYVESLVSPFTLM